MVLNHPEADAAVLETARGGILREGLGFDRSDVAIVTNIGEGDHLGTSDVDTPEQLAYVKSTIVWAVRPEGHAVLNANDPLVVDMAKWCPGKIVYFALKEDQPVLAAHRDAGGKVAFVRNNDLILADGANETNVLSLTRVPLTHGGRVAFHVENALAATAAAWVLGGPRRAAPRPRVVRAQDGPGPGPLQHHGHPRRDRGPGLRAQHLRRGATSWRCSEQFPHRRRSVVYSAAGDRRDADIVAQGEQLGAAFDRVFIYEDTYLRRPQEGRDHGVIYPEAWPETGAVQDIRSIKAGCWPSKSHSPPVSLESY